jgi:hypothetical protein
MSKCKHCGYHLDMHSDLCERIQKEIARAEKAEAERDELKKLSSHGNGEILLGWMDAHRKAMDRIKVLETALVELFYNPYPSASKLCALDDTPKAH